MDKPFTTSGVDTSSPAPQEPLYDILTDLSERDGMPGRWSVLDVDGRPVTDPDEFRENITVLRHIASVVVTDGEYTYNLTLTRRS